MNEKIEKTKKIEQEIITTINKQDELRKSQAKRIKNIITKHKAWKGARYNTTNFQEPVMFLERRSGEVEFYENATMGLFEYEHSDGEKRFLILTPSKLKKHGYADRAFKGYWCHEDHPLPLPEEPLITTEQVNIIVDKSLNDIKEWKAKEVQAWSNLTWTILIGIAIVIVAVALLVMLWPEKVPETTKTVIQTINQTGGIPP